MNEYARANKIVHLYDNLVESKTLPVLEMLIKERLEQIRDRGVALGMPQQKRDENAGAYNELSNFLTKLMKQYDDAKELLKQDKDTNPPDGNS